MSLAESNVRYLEMSSDHYQCWGISCWKKFRNVFPELDSERKFKHLWEFLCTNQGNQPHSEDDANRHLPIAVPNFTPPTNGMKVTWFGHSTVLIQDEHTNILLDPVFGNRASPFSFIGPKRYRPTPCTLDQLPPIHMVFISHDHFDHFDIEAVKQLTRKWNPVFFVGRESNDLFPKNAKVVYLDWNRPITEQVNEREYTVHFFPVCHWSKRGIFDTNKRLWGGFVITTPEKMKVFYPGDTGFCDVFKEIGEMYHSFDLAFIPIGAYKTRAFLAPQHVDPGEAIDIHKLIGSKKSVGVHWGTFPLGKQHYLQPRNELEAQKRTKNIPPEDFICMQHGANFTIARLRREDVNS